MEVSFSCWTKEEKQIIFFCVSVVHYLHLQCLFIYKALHLQVLARQHALAHRMALQRKKHLAMQSSKQKIVAKKAGVSGVKAGNMPTVVQDAVSKDNPREPRSPAGQVGI